MPTAASPDDAEQAAGLHRQREVAQSFGGDAARYDRARPGYPSALVERVIAASPGRDVLDVGMGTGTAARSFRDGGCTVLGVEPDPRMAAVARAQGFTVEVAAFEEWDPAGRSFDAVIAGQAWHWIDALAGATKAATLLRPGGRLAVFWNAAEYPPALREVYRRTLPDTVLAQSGRRESYTVFYDLAADGIIRAQRFTEPERWFVDWSHTYTAEEWLDQVPSFGGHRTLPPGKLDELLTGLAAAIDATGGTVTIEYTAGAVTAFRS